MWEVELKMIWHVRTKQNVRAFILFYYLIINNINIFVLLFYFIYIYFASAETHGRKYDPDLTGCPVPMSESAHNNPDMDRVDTAVVGLCTVCWLSDEVDCPCPQLVNPSSQQCLDGRKTKPWSEFIFSFTNATVTWRTGHRTISKLLMIMTRDGHFHLRPPFYFYP